MSLYFLLCQTIIIIFKLLFFYKGAELAVSCEHIISKVELKWVLPECEGKATLHGISLTSAMAQLITVSPVHWGMI